MKSLVLQEISKQYIATNNGLEQVYQNRLVEGIDYEKYDYLVGDGEAYIAIPTFTNFDIIAHRDSTSINNTIIVGTYTQFKGVTYSANIAFTQQVNRSGGTVTGIFKTSIPIGLEVVIQKRMIGGYAGLKFNGANCIRNANEPIYNGYDLRTTTKLISNRIAISSFKANTIYGNSDKWSCVFSPCKLLSPCPANLSSTGKAYPVGECGMIDSVSGKFYGNSGSGSFSVYNDPTE